MLKTFKLGGIHPPENKLSASQEVKVLPLPDKVIIPLGQHIGAPAIAIVKKGDIVKVGQLIAEASGAFSANIHSSVSGKVLSLDPVIDASGMPKPSITIKVDGDEWMEDINLDAVYTQELELDSKIIKDAISKAGVVGLGGATFPTHIKLSPPPGNKAEFLVINGVECEPYLTSDHRLMLEKAKELLLGVKFVMTAIDVEKAVIGIENNKRDAIAILKDLAINYKGIKICPLKVQYPQGGEKQLIQATTGRSVPSGALPISVGAVVQNVGTIYAVYEAIVKNKPLIERIVTITGKSLATPGNYLCRIGTPISKLIEIAGGLPEDTAKVIGGGPMMGRAIINVDAPIVKGSSGILIINNKEAARKSSRTCIRCAKCVNVCCMGLEPYLLSKLSETNNLESLEENKVTDCIECGSCSFTCPSARPLLDYIRLGKGRTIAMIRGRNSK